MGAIAQRVRARTAALVRTEPLPVGRYWIDVFVEPFANRSIWDVWLQNALMTDSVHVEVTEHRPADSGGPARDFFIFRVKKPLGWMIAEYVGWPNTAPSGIKSSDDTVQKPPPEPGLLDTLRKDGLPGWVPWAVGGTIAVVGLVALSKLVRG